MSKLDCNESGLHQEQMNTFAEQGFLDKNITRKKFMLQTAYLVSSLLVFPNSLQAKNIIEKTIKNKSNTNKHCKTKDNTIYKHEARLVNDSQIVSKIWQNNRPLMIESTPDLSAINQLRPYEKTNGSHFMFMPAANSKIYIIVESTIIEHKMECLQKESKEFHYPMSINDILLPKNLNIDNPKTVIEKSYILSPTSVYYPVKANGKRTRIKLVNIKCMRTLHSFCLYKDHLLILNNWNSAFYLKIFNIKTNKTVKEITLNNIERIIYRIDNKEGQPVIIGQNKIYYLNIPDFQKKEVASIE